MEDKMLQKRIEAIKEYFRGIETYNEALIIRVVFPEKWGVYPSNDEKIKVAKSEKAVGEYYYYADQKEIDLNIIFDLIEETIEMNKNVILKVELLRVKVNELKELFDIKPLEELQTLRFVTKAPKKRPAKKAKTTKVEPKTNETITETSEA